MIDHTGGKNATVPPPSSHQKLFFSHRKSHYFSNLDSSGTAELLSKMEEVFQAEGIEERMI